MTQSNDRPIIESCQSVAISTRPALITYRFTPSDAPPYIAAWVSPRPSLPDDARPPAVRLDYDPSAPDDEQHCAALARLIVKEGLRCNAVGAYHDERLVVWVCTDSTEGE